MQSLGSWFMNRTIPCFLITVILFSSCRSMSYYETPNGFRNLPATVYLANGRSYHGKTIVHTNKHSKSAVKLYADGDRKPMRFRLNEVKGYELRNNYYELKELRGGFRLTREYWFMKRLTEENSKLHLYEHLKKVTNPSGKHTSAYTTYETEYFLQLPGEDYVWPLNSSRFTPNFDEKMSKLLADCPELVSKISNKEQGYFYAQFTIFKEKRPNVLLNIIDEYNQCGK